MPQSTLQDKLDLYYLIRNIRWQNRLDDVEAEVVKRIRALLGELRQETRARMDRYVSGSYSEKRTRAVLAEINVLLSAANTQSADLVADAVAAVGAFSLTEQSAILGLDGSARNVCGLSMGATEFGALFLAAPLGGKTLQGWVDSAFESGVQGQIVDAVQSGLFLGEGYPKLIDRVLQEGIGITEREATTLVRTYVQGASVAAQEAVYEANSDIVREVEWSAILEPGYAKTGRGTCLRCSALDGTRYKQGDKNRPPMPLHPRCRCMWRPVVDWAGIGLPELEIRERVRPYTIRPDANIDAGGVRTILEVGQHKGDYAGWFESRGETFQRNVLGEGRYELYQQGMPFKDFVNRRTGELYTLGELTGATHIRFRPAQSVREATLQAQEMGVRALYEGSDLNMFRAVNNAMAQVKTRGYPLPSRVAYDASFFVGEPNAIMAYLPARDALLFRPRLRYSDVAKLVEDQSADNFWSTASALHPILHEVGHQVHVKNSRDLYLASAKREFSAPLARRIEREVSGYAAFNAQEFVAEVFAGIIDGKVYGRRVLALFQQYGGYIK